MYFYHNTPGYWSLLISKPLDITAPNPLNDKLMFFAVIFCECGISKPLLLPLKMYTAPLPSSSSGAPIAMSIKKIFQ